MVDTSKALTAAKNKLKDAKAIADKNAVWMFRPDYYKENIPYLQKGYTPKLWMSDYDGGFIHNALENPNSYVQEGLNKLYNQGTRATDSGLIKYTEPSEYFWFGEEGGTHHLADSKGKDTLKGVSLNFERPSQVEAYASNKVRSNGGESFDAKKMPTPSDAKKVAGAKLNLADVKKRLRKTAELAGKIAKKAIKAVF